MAKTCAMQAFLVSKGTELSQKICPVIGLTKIVQVISALQSKLKKNWNRWLKGFQDITLKMQKALQIGAKTEGFFLQ